MKAGVVSQVLLVGVVGSVLRYALQPGQESVGRGKGESGPTA